MTRLSEVVASKTELNVLEWQLMTGVCGVNLVV